MKIGKLILAGLFTGIVVFVVGNLSYQINQSLYSDPAAAHLWKQMPMPGWLVVLLVTDIFAGLIYASTYAMVGKALSGGIINKGLFFGLIIWAVGTIPGMLMTFITMAVPNAIVKIWTVEGLISALISGVVIAAIYRE